MLHCNCLSRHATYQITFRKDKATRYTPDSQLEKASISRPKILILNEAKENASDLGNIYPAFKRVITKFPESICQDNDQVFDKWRTLLVHIDTYTDTYTFLEEDRKGVFNYPCIWLTVICLYLHYHRCWHLISIIIFADIPIPDFLLSWLLILLSVLFCP